MARPPRPAIPFMKEARGTVAGFEVPDCEFPMERKISYTQKPTQKSALGHSSENILRKGSESQCFQLYLPHHLCHAPQLSC